MIEERKFLPEDYLSRIELRPKRGHKERELEIGGEGENRFVIILRQSALNPLDFSAILGYRIPNTNVVLRLRRYNGKSHFHSNRIEGNEFYDFHVHYATERYQLLGMEEDSYAQPTDKYSNLTQAIDCLLKECGFVFPQDNQMHLF